VFQCTFKSKCDLKVNVTSLNQQFIDLDMHQVLGFHLTVSPGEHLKIARRSFVLTLTFNWSEVRPYLFKSSKILDDSNMYLRFENNKFVI
jgi:hypothetical protein